MRCRCELLSAEGDPIRVMEVTQQMVEKVDKAEQLLGVSIPVGNGNGDGSKVAVGASVKSAGSSLKKTSSFMGRCDRSDKSRYISAEKPKDRSDKSRSISTEKPKVVSAAACVHSRSTCRNTFMLLCSTWCCFAMQYI